MVTGFMAGVALGQKIVGAGKASKVRVPMSPAEQRLQSAKLAAFKRMKARQIAESQKNFAASNINNFTDTLVSALSDSNDNKNFSGQRRGSRGQRNNFTTAEEIAFDKGFNYEFKDDASGILLNSVRGSIKDFNDWIKQKTGGLLDLNMSMAIFFIIRGIRRIILEKQYPNAWQLIWWATSILRGWRFM